MKLELFVALAATLLQPAATHGQSPLESELKAQTWLEKYGRQIDQPFSGPLSFSHLPYKRCLEEEDTYFDIAILGMPFDTGVTYRNGWASVLVRYSRDIGLNTAPGHALAHTRSGQVVGDRAVPEGTPWLGVIIHTLWGTRLLTVVMCGFLTTVKETL